MIELTAAQVEMVNGDGHALVTGGPGSGKTTVSILKAIQIAKNRLRLGQRVLFLSFARASVSRIIEAIDEENRITPAVRRLIEVDTYHSFFWNIIKTHGYLVGLPRKLDILTPPNEAISLSTLRSEYKAASKLTNAEKDEKAQRELAERIRLSKGEGLVCFDLFAEYAGQLLHGSRKIRELVSNSYPFIVLDEFQDTNAGQWNVVKALGINSTLIALADPEQRIYDFIGADPERPNHFRVEYKASEYDLGSENHRSADTEIVTFADDILKGKFSKTAYDGISFEAFEANQNQALTKVVTTVLQARSRLVKSGKKDWSLAVLVPTKRMTRVVSDAFRMPQGRLSAIQHHAAIDMEAAILASEVVAWLMQPGKDGQGLATLNELICSFYLGKGGNKPSKTNLNEAARIKAALQKAVDSMRKGKSIPKNSVLRPIIAVYKKARDLALSGDPEQDWLSVRKIMDEGPCKRLKVIAAEVKNVRLLERGAQLRDGLSENWRNFGAYKDALEIVRQAFVQEHFSTATRPETGVVVMNMHKAKGKQFDEVIIFEGWPIIRRGKIESNPNRIVHSNLREGNLDQARQNLRVSITRARRHTTILTPRVDPCVLLLEE